MKNLLFILSILLIFTACSEDSSGPSTNNNTPPGGVFYFSKMDFSSEFGSSDIAKYDLSTGVEEILVKSARLSSAPAKGKMIFITDSILGYDEYEFPIRILQLISSNIDGTNQKVIVSTNEEDNSDEWIGSPILSPQADKIVYNKYSYDEETGEEFDEMLVCDINGNNKSVFFESEIPGQGIAFSNDGKKLAFADYENKLFVYDIATKSIIVEVDNIDVSGDFQSPITWTNDDSKLIFTARSLTESKNELVIMNSDGTGLKRIPNDMSCGFATLSFDNSKLGFTLMDFENDIYSIMESDLEGNNQQIFLEGKPGENYLFPMYCPDGKTMLIHMSQGDLEDFSGITFGKVDIATKEITKIFNQLAGMCFFEK